MLTRDSSRCIFCDETNVSNLEAAHIFDVQTANKNAADNSTIPQSLGILDVYDPSNGVMSRLS